MPNCRKCNGPIFWAWDGYRERWIPSDISSIHGDEVGFEGGVLYERHHQRHRCETSTKSPPPPPPPVQAWQQPSSHHATLYVLPNAPKEVIRAAYRALATIHHPDAGGDSERMIEINKAYAALCGER